MQPRDRWARLRALMRVRPAQPALVQAQYQAFSGLIPLMYAILLVNTWALAISHRELAPAWLTTYVPLLFTPIWLLRCLGWWRARGRTVTAGVAERAVRRTSWLAWPLTAAFSAWALALFPYGDAYSQSHVAFFMAVTLLGMLPCLMHLRPAMLSVAAIMGLSFIGYFAASGQPTFVAMAINMALVGSILIAVMLRQYLGFTELVSARLQAEALGTENLRLANLDSLTGLPNRRAFFSALEDCCRRSRQGNRRFAVALVDLDGFKSINDLYGHAIGDQLLVQVGRRLSAMDTGHVARLGGDEFALVLEGLDDDAAISRRAREVCARLQDPFSLHETSLQVAASLGLVIYPDLAGNALDLYECADYALYEGKRSARGSVSLFSTGHHHRIQRDAAIEQALRGADLEAEFSVVFQPIVDIASRDTVAFEALARWNSPVLGPVSPADFIPLAERTGLVTQLTRVLLAKSLATAAHWPAQVGLSFNLSTHDLGSEAEVRALIGLVQRSGVDPGRIDMEITETAVMQDLAQVQWAAAQLRELGCGVTLDDFGTGFSTLSRLLALPLTRIKVDRRFVCGIQDSPTSIKIVRSLLTLARDMEVGCVVEGVETVAELDTLRELGAGLMQGYLCARPMPPAAVGHWLRDADSLAVLRHSAA
jgi:diguanylate cyclase (GGDEF)-like protein